MNFFSQREINSLSLRIVEAQCLEVIKEEVGTFLKDQDIGSIDDLAW